MAYAVAAARHNHNNNNVVDSGDKQTATASPSIYRYFLHIYESATDELQSRPPLHATHSPRAQREQRQRRRPQRDDVQSDTLEESVALCA